MIERSSYSDRPAFVRLVCLVLRSCSYFVVGMAISVRGNMADIYAVLTVIIVISFVMLLFINTKHVETAPE
ncbi:MAG: hypothetical protein HFG80_06985 [Eubacterium sp.]|nr:hypothetical protein [Eubacterium sp.]